MTDEERVKQATKAMKAVYNYFAQRGQPVGGTASALAAVGGTDLITWLSKQTPEGATILETLAAIAIDAMNEENDQ
jgi:hypothetical protein